jgi:hypothetical protein
LTISSFLAFVTPAIAEVQKAEGMLKVSLMGMQESEQWWDRLWKETFDPTNVSNNLSTYTFVSAVRFLIVLGLIFWVFQFGQKMVESKGVAQSVTVGLHSFFPVFIALIFLSNQALYSRVLAYGLRDISNSWSEGVMQAQLHGQTIRSSLADQLITQDIKNEIAMQTQKCQQMPQPAVALPSIERPKPDPNKPLTIQQEQAYQYLECFDKLIDFIESRRVQTTNTNCSVVPGSPNKCNFFQRYMDASQAVLDKYRTETRKRLTEGTYDPVADVKNFRTALSEAGAAGLASAVNPPILNATQWLWINFLEMGMWLSALFAPMFIAVSIIPGRQNMFVTWLIGFLTIGLAKLAYTVIIGVVAAQLSDGSVLLTADKRFAMTLGAFAPGVSLAIVTGGGLAAAMSYRNQSVAVVGAATGAISSAISTIGYSVSRYADKRR